jgi:hypothetical protein
MLLHPCGKPSVGKKSVLHPCGKISSSREMLPYPYGKASISFEMLLHPCGKVSRRFERLSQGCSDPLGGKTELFAASQKIAYCIPATRFPEAGKYYRRGVAPPLVGKLIKKIPATQKTGYNA